METPPFAAPPSAPQRQNSTLVWALLIGALLLLCLCVTGFGAGFYYLNQQMESLSRAQERGNPGTMEGYGEPETVSRKDELWAEFRLSDFHWRVELPGTLKPAGRTFEPWERRSILAWSAYEFGYSAIGGDMYATQYGPGIGYSVQDFIEGDLDHMRDSGEFTNIKSFTKRIGNRNAGVATATWRTGGQEYETAAYHWVKGDLARSLRLTWYKSDSEGKAAHNRILQTLAFEE